MTRDWPKESNQILIQRIDFCDMISAVGFIRKVKASPWLQGLSASAPLPGLNLLLLENGNFYKKD